jgi:hypothetical protein
MYFFGQYYYLIIILQAFCAIHSYRRGTLNRWIYLIIFLPAIGSIIYIFSEVLSNRNFSKPSIDVSAVFNPGGKIKKLEEDLGFSDTFANKVKLADAYLAAGYTDKAVDLYTSSLTGAFTENEHVLAQLILAYYQLEQYEEVIPRAKKIYHLPQFTRSRAHTTYAKALEKLGDTDLAENEFKLMKGRFSYYEPRYEYGLFLVRNGREKDAYAIFNDMLNEEKQLSPMERKTNHTWFSKVRDELKNLTPVQKHV